ncbi:PPOX class F420-dependent enzyme [Actinosynnema sp. ALI-1.44]|uniref:PPOX class F420-dependent oxidoreductase n=1 Tax=Actinosynnema sp. ALI-1.44 TaxID=1933779 RepID=UPI00097CA677|nr:PPOX class F420-dependent oxidoreductase [Actinosynnema sp. ALI-1.44]ONI77112.1 PPOX class F420-dependent enzyme [Actinosynnema sp. ALI-1.44]
MDEKLRDLVATSTKGVLVTLKRDGRPQLSNVSYKFADGVIRVSVTDGRAKTRNLLRDPRASFYVTNDTFRRYAVAEGTATLSDVATAPDDDAVGELVELYRSVVGEHPDWDEYRAAMVADKRRVVRIPVDRIYGLAMD